MQNINADTSINDDLNLFISSLLGTPIDDISDKPKVESVDGESSNKQVSRMLASFDKATRLKRNLGKKALYNQLKLEDDWDEERAKEAIDMFIAGNAPKKVQDRMTYFVEFAAGHTEGINSFQSTAIKVLIEDGKIDCKKTGSFYKAMVNYPSHAYGVGTINSCTASSLRAMQLLKIVVQDKEGNWVPNKKSTFLKVLRQKLGV